ncbi:MAG: hypothetical protein AB1427_01955 [Thermodesulfobacteriota bacterium]
MKTLIQTIGLFMFFLLIFSSPATADYFDQNGVKVDKDRYEKTVQMRAADINKINKDGYGEPSSRLEDPVRLRNKRIEQWKLEQKKGR